jgi:CubicO group peptidase (beta-lactamase class C family)
MMKRLAFFVFSTCAVAFSSQFCTADQSLPRSTPESQGVSSSGIRDYIVAADKDVKSMHSFMLLRHGKVIAEAWWAPHTAEEQHVLWSLSKSFTSTAVGLAINERKLALDDKVLKFFPEEAPAEVSEYLADMSVRDLLCMAAGHEKEPQLKELKEWRKAFLSHPVKFEPGTHFVYNTPATYMLSAIVQKVTGQTVLEYLKPRLFEPLGIDNPKWETSPEGVTLGGYGLFVRTEDIAKFGQLYLQKGKWNGEQIVPEEWVEMATSKQVSNGSDPKSDWNQGYGFQFWRCRHNAFRGDGRDGQFCVVLPEKDAVIAITANTASMPQELNIVWDHLLPAFSDEKVLPENAQAQNELQETIKALKASR